MSSAIDSASPDARRMLSAVRLRVLGVDVEADHTRAVARRAAGDGLTNAGARTDYRNNAPVESKQVVVHGAAATHVRRR